MLLAMTGSLLDRHLIYITGKGGTGKTTVAAALGIAAAARGRRTIVVEVAEQDRVSRAFRREGVGHEVEVQLAENLWAISSTRSSRSRSGSPSSSARPSCTGSCARTPSSTSRPPRPA